MEEYLEQYMEYLRNVKRASVNTSLSYGRDLRKMIRYFDGQGINDIGKITRTNINSYMLYIEKQTGSSATISRYIASMRAFFVYMKDMGVIKECPVNDIKAPKIVKKMPDILSVDEMLLLLEQPDVKSDKGIRDKAMLELLYATGMRVSELINLKISDVNMEMGYVTCTSAGKTRVIPFNQEAGKALEAYIGDVRKKMIANEDEDVLFTNCNGEPMSRQGFWKIIKYYEIGRAHV